LMSLMFNEQISNLMPQILEMTKSRREYSESAKPLRREGLAIMPG